MQDVGRLLSAQALKPTQKRRFPQTGGQGQHRPRHGVVPVIEWNGAFRQSVQRRGPILMPEPRAFSDVFAGVNGDPGQPRLFLRCPTESAIALPGLQKGFLHRVLGQGRVLQIGKA